MPAECYSLTAFMAMLHSLVITDVNGLPSAALKTLRSCMRVPSGQEKRAM